MLRHATPALATFSRARRRARLIISSWYTNIFRASGEDSFLRASDAEVLVAADFRAEQYAAHVRFAISVFLFLFFAAIVLSVGRINFWLAGVASANVLLACCSVYVTRRKIFRRWFPWLIGAGDAVFLFGVGWFGPWLEILPAGFAFALISQWAVFLVLSIESLRAQAKTILFQTVLICGLLSILTWAPIDGSYAPSLGGFEQLFSSSSNLTRLAIIFLSGLVLAAGAQRSRSALKLAIIATRERSALQRFHPREISHEITSDDLEELMTGRRHKVSILFADMRGFTSLSEDVAPERVVKLLTSFRRRSEKVVREHGGVIDKFIGDGFLAVFGLMAPRQEDAQNSVTASVALLQEIERWSNKRTSEGRKAVSVGIGLHTGDVFVGVVGTERMEFTVIGDAVNVAQRLEAMTRDVGCSLIASEAVLSDAHFDPRKSDEWKPFPNLKLRGRLENLRAYGAYMVPAQPPIGLTGNLQSK